MGRGRKRGGTGREGRREEKNQGCILYHLLHTREQKEKLEGEN